MPLNPPRQYGDILLPGAHIAWNYVVDALARVGGFSALYRGHRVDDGVVVALKVLRSSLASSDNHRRRFRQEAETLLRLRHPNIIDILAVGELDDGRPFIAMEWSDGGDLLTRLHGHGPFDLERAMAVLQDVGAGLAAAHRVGVIHRDLKAQNVMTVDAVGSADRASASGFTCKLIDFGIAKLTASEDAHGSVTTWGIMGTATTMAPEQILAEPVDARTDIYAMGILLYHVLVGRLPFDGSDAGDIEVMHLRAPRPVLSRDAPVSAALDRVVARAMAVQPHERHASVEALLADLADAIRPGGVRAGRRPLVRAGLGMYVHVKPRDAAAHTGDEDALDDVLDFGVEAMTECGLQVVEELSNAVLGGRVLPADPDAARGARAALLESALTLGQRIESRAGDAFAVCVAVRVASLELVDEERSARWVGGDLLRLSEWPEARTGVCVLAHGSALVGLDYQGAPCRTSDADDPEHHSWSPGDSGAFVALSSLLMP